MELEEHLIGKKMVFTGSGMNSHTPSKTGQAFPCPIHLFFHFASDSLSKITLEDSGHFQLTFLGEYRQKEEVLKWFDHYFQGIILPFPLALEAKMGPFSQRVLEQMMNIPIGQTASYREIAVALGSPLAARAVGNACHNNPFPFVIPCHRVVKTDGSLGGFAYGLEIKKRLLDFEKTIVTLPTQAL